MLYLETEAKVMFCTLCIEENGEIEDGRVKKSKNEYTELPPNVAGYFCRSW